MPVCTSCKRNFNEGLYLSTGPICTVCTANVALPEGDQAIVEAARGIGQVFGGHTELASRLASRLLRSMLYVLIAAAVVIVFYLVLLLISSTLGILVGPGGFLTTFLIGSVIILLVGLVFLLSWLSMINDALEATNAGGVVPKVIASFIIPPYGLLLTFSLRSQLLRTPNSVVSYGRWNIV